MIEAIVQIAPWLVALVLVLIYRRDAMRVDRYFGALVLKDRADARDRENHVRQQYADASADLVARYQAALLLERKKLTELMVHYEAACSALQRARFTPSERERAASPSPVATPSHEDRRPRATLRRAEPDGPMLAHHDANAEGGNA